VIPHWQWIAIAALILGAVAAVIAANPGSYLHNYFTGYCFTHYRDIRCHCYGRGCV
jgi:hypothetical protein